MSSAAPGWAQLPDDLVRDILSRLPIDHARFTFLASVTCKEWYRIASESGFLLHLHNRYGPPPLLGFLRNPRNESVPMFYPVTASPFPLARVPDHRSWTILDYRHGKALFITTAISSQRELLVWEPITGDQWRVPFPEACESHYPGAAVICARPGCDHRGGCHGGDFRVVFIFTAEESFEPKKKDICTNCCMYSSESGSWGKSTLLHGVYEDFGEHSSVLIGDSLLYFLSDGHAIMEYDLASGLLNVILPPVHERMTLMVAGNGGIGIAEETGSYVILWSLEPVADEKTEGCKMFQWQRSCLIDIAELNLPFEDFLTFVYRRVEAPIYAEEANAIVLCSYQGMFVFSPYAESQQEGRMVCEYLNFIPLVPVVNFYAPPKNLLAPHGENPNEEHGASEQGEPIESANQVCCKGLDAVKEADFLVQDLNLAPRISMSEEVDEIRDDAGKSKASDISAKDAPSLEEKYSDEDNEAPFRKRRRRNTA